MKKNVPAGQPFYLHTEPLEPAVPSWGPRATVAVSMVGDSIFWGIAICSDNDNFERAKGRELAAQRMQNGFGRIQARGAYFEKFETVSQCLCDQASGIAAKVMDNFNKWKHRINEFEENLAATVEEPTLASTEPE